MIFNDDIQCTSHGGMGINGEKYHLMKSSEARIGAAIPLRIRQEQSSPQHRMAQKVPRFVPSGGKRVGASRRAGGMSCTLQSKERGKVRFTNMLVGFFVCKHISICIYVYPMLQKKIMC